jgi:hypothetical protein
MSHAEMLSRLDYARAECRRACDEAAREIRELSFDAPSADVAFELMTDAILLFSFIPFDSGEGAHLLSECRRIRTRLLTQRFARQARATVAQVMHACVALIIAYRCLAKVAA